MEETFEGILTRDYEGDDGTFGRLTLEGGFHVETVELPWRGNRHNVSRIPPGEYRVEVVNSPKHGPGTLELQDVPDRGNIQIHVGNWGGDRELVNPKTARKYKSDLLGCIAVGLVRLDDLMGQRGVSQSGGPNGALALLKRHVGGRPFTLTVVDRFVETREVA